MARRSKSPAPAAPAARARSPAPRAKAGGGDAPAGARSEKTMATVVVMCLYMAMSVGTTFMNKFSFPKEKFPHPFSATCFQMVVAVFWLLLLTGVQSLALKEKKPALATAVLRAFGASETEPLRWCTKDILSSAGVAGAFTGMLSAGNMCLLFVQVSFYQAAKSQHILCNLLMGFFLFGTTQPAKIVLCCVGVTVGFLVQVTAESKVLEDMARTNDFATDLLKGCVAGLVSSFFVALYPILLDRSFLKGSDTWQVTALAALHLSRGLLRRRGRSRDVTRGGTRGEIVILLWEQCSSGKSVVMGRVQRREEYSETRPVELRQK